MTDVRNALYVDPGEGEPEDSRSIQEIKDDIDAVFDEVQAAVKHRVAKLFAYGLFIFMMGIACGYTWCYMALNP